MRPLKDYGEHACPALAVAFLAETCLRQAGLLHQFLYASDARAYLLYQLHPRKEAKNQRISGMACLLSEIE
jgi:hypothetical protein